MADPVLGAVADATICLIAFASEKLNVALGWKGDLNMLCHNM